MSESPRPFDQDPDPVLVDAVAADDDTIDLDAPEVARLQAEVATLRAQLDSGERRAFATRATRAAAATVLVVIVAFTSVASVVGLWAAGTALNTDRWVAAVAPLPKDPQVSAAVAQFATTEIWRVVDVDQRVRQALPDQAGFLAVPITSQVREYVQRTFESLIRSDRFQRVWTEANRRAHQQVVAVLNGSSDMVRANGDRVVIDLLPLINQVLRELGAQLPTLFGHSIDLPDLSNGKVPAQLRTIVGNAIGITLPADFGQFTVYDHGRLTALQRTVVAMKRDLTALILATVLLFGLAVAVSPQRRRDLLQLGLWLMVAAIGITASLRTVRADLLARVPAGTYRDGAAAAVTSVTGSLRDRGVQIIWLGAALAVVTYLLGPGRGPVRLRRAATSTALAGRRGLKRVGRAAIANGPTWIGRHQDAVRIAGVACAGLVALMVSTWAGLLVTAAALVAFELFVTVVARAAAAQDHDTPDGPAAPESIAEHDD